MGSMSRVLANDIAARGRPELNMYTSFIVITVNVIGNLLLIPKFGLPGAALATTIAYTLNCSFRILVYSILSKKPWYGVFLFNSYDRGVLQHIIRLKSKLHTPRTTIV